MTEKEKALARITSELEGFAQLLEPHLWKSAEAKKSGGQERWSARKALAFILATSLLAWAVVLALIYMLV